MERSTPADLPVASAFCLEAEFPAFVFLLPIPTCRAEGGGPHPAMLWQPAAGCPWRTAVGTGAGDSLWPGAKGAAGHAHCHPPVVFKW